MAYQGGYNAGYGDAEIPAVSLASVAAPPTVSSPAATTTVFSELSEGD